MPEREGVRRWTIYRYPEMPDGETDTWRVAEVGFTHRRAECVPTIEAAPVEGLVEAAETLLVNLDRGPQRQIDNLSPQRLQLREALRPFTEDTDHE